MINKIINYTDFNGDECTDEYYFNLSKAEIFSLDFDYASEGGFVAHLLNVAKSGDPKGLWNLIKGMVDKSVGKRSADGKRFIKSKEILEEFRSTEGYGELLIELVTDSEKLNEFVTGIVDKALQDAKKANGGVLPDVSNDPRIKELKKLAGEE